MSLVNSFLVGCDPEFIAQDPPNLVRASDIPPHRAMNTWQLRNMKHCNSWGLDHGDWVFEPHPLPNVSCREVIKNLKRSLQAMVPMLEIYNWRSGAYVSTPQRSISLGGHVHIDLPKATRSQINALNCFTRTLLHLDILPELENRDRRDNGEYGRYGDIRTEHGHFEYRTFPSWLYNQRVAMLCLTGSKLAVVKPDTILGEFGDVLDEPFLRSKGALKGWFENFKGDDDVDYILEKKFFEGKLEAMPDRDLKEAWRLSDEPEASEKVITEELNRQVRAAQTAQEATMAQQRAWAAQTQQAVGIGGMAALNSAQFIQQQHVAETLRRRRGGITAVRPEAFGEYETY